MSFRWIFTLEHSNFSISMSSQILTTHDDFIKWKHFPHCWPFVRGIHRSPVNSPHKGQWRGALMFSLICVWINGWVNNREAVDLRCHCAHYDVIVMEHIITLVCQQVMVCLQYIQTHECFIVVFYNNANKDGNIRTLLCSDVIISAMASQITGVSIVYSTACSNTDKENIKAPFHWPLWGEFTGVRWIPRTKAVTRKMFPFDDIIMNAFHIWPFKHNQSIWLLQWWQIHYCG